MDLKGKKVLATMPGRHGDILWALPTLRSIAQATGEKPWLMISGKYQAIGPVVAAQPYIEDVVIDRHWKVRETAPITPAEPDELVLPEKADVIIHLGYQRWPLEPSLPEEILWNAERQLGVALPDLDLHRPWIQAETLSGGLAPILAVAFTDEWAELKMGVLAAVLAAGIKELYPEDCDLVAKAGSRVIREWDFGLGVQDGPFKEAAICLNSAKVVLTCNSALWVLAAGLGRPIVMVEPNADRHNKVFLPKEWAHCMVLGGDGRPTFDARAVVEAVERAQASPGRFSPRSHSR